MHFFNITNLINYVSTATLLFTTYIITLHGTV
jgi:hypothetical protein